MINDIILQAENISCKLGNRMILKNIDWEIQKGENWVIYGLNGSGKTTLLSVIAAYLGMYQGKLRIFDEEVTKTSRMDLRRRIGFVSSSFFNRYYREESLLEIVLSGKFGRLGLQKDVSQADVRAAKELLSEFGLKQRVQYPYYMLSQGQQQKVLIARGIWQNPQLLILDEPCSGMDILAKEKFLNYLAEMACEKKLTLIYVTHYAEEILPIFSKALLLKDHEIYFKGNIGEAFSDKMMSEFLDCPASVQWFWGRPSIRLHDNAFGGGDLS